MNNDEKRLRLVKAQANFFKAVGEGWLNTGIANAIRQGADLHGLDANGNNAIEFALLNNRVATAVAMIFLDVEITETVRKSTSKHIEKAIILKEEGIGYKEYLGNHQFADSKVRDLNNIRYAKIEGDSNREFLLRDSSKKLNLKHMNPAFKREKEREFKPTKKELEQIESGHDEYNDWDPDYDFEQEYVY